jgi:hypothetical protein
MSFLSTSGTPIPCKLQDVDEDIDEFGDYTRAISGNALSRVTARKRNIPLLSKPLTDAQHTTIWALLTAPAPVTFTGDLFAGASVPCVVEITGRKTIKAGGLRRLISFTLHEV